MSTQALPSTGYFYATILLYKLLPHSPFTKPILIFSLTLSLSLSHSLSLHLHFRRYDGFHCPFPIPLFISFPLCFLFSYLSYHHPSRSRRHEDPLPPRFRHFVARLSRLPIPQRALYFCRSTPTFESYIHPFNHSFQSHYQQHSHTQKTHAHHRHYHKNTRIHRHHNFQHLRSHRSLS